ncbi:hypothetical protein [Bradyrhizobium sp. Ai1a-2]|uniref:hypothetical protein n=1 Tax=Bradyrhizobium sp. Ai1a-2 TaxID=196490 RepID=UPI000480A289|nr:hypothetical protein [Bradyrhizobium sp. Ai1a-2]
MAMIKRMLNGGEPQGGGPDASEDAGLFERVMNGKDATPQILHPDEAADKRQIDRELDGRGDVTRTDPSVHSWQTLQQGEPWGSVPLERTLRKPDAYYPARKGPK